METKNTELLQEKKIEDIILSITENIINNDKQAINNDIDKLDIARRKLQLNAFTDKIFFSLNSWINRMVASDPTVRFSACENVQGYINQIFDDIDLEKETLNIIKKYLKYCKRYKDYDCLVLSYTILVGISILQKARIQTLDTDFHTHICAMRAINYIPVSNTQKIDEEGIEILKSDIKTSCKLLERKK